MNKLQNLKTDKNYFLTLNPVDDPKDSDENKVIKQDTILHTLILIHENVELTKMTLHSTSGKKKNLVLWKLILVMVFTKMV